MTEIFAVFHKASGFLSQSSEYAFECCRKQLGRYGPVVDRVAFFTCVHCHRPYSSPGVDLVLCTVDHLLQGQPVTYIP